MSAISHAVSVLGPVGARVDVLGCQLEIVARLGAEENDAVVFRMSLSAGQSVPIHSHVDPECVYVLSGQIETFVLTGTRAWRTIEAGQTVLFVDGLKHAIRNVGTETADLILVTNNRLARFFFKIGRAAASSNASVSPSVEDVERISRVAREYGYQQMSPAESAAITDQVGGTNGPATALVSSSSARSSRGRGACPLIAPDG